MARLSTLCSLYSKVEVLSLLSPSKPSRLQTGQAVVLPHCSKVRRRIPDQPKGIFFSCHVQTNRGHMLSLFRLRRRARIRPTHCGPLALSSKRKRKAHCAVHTSLGHSNAWRLCATARCPTDPNRAKHLPTEACPNPKFQPCKGVFSKRQLLYRMFDREKTRLQQTSVDFRSRPKSMQCSLIVFDFRSGRWRRSSTFPRWACENNLRRSQKIIGSTRAQALA